MQPSFSPSSSSDASMPPPQQGSALAWHAALSLCQRLPLLGELMNEVRLRGCTKTKSLPHRLILFPQDCGLAAPFWALPNGSTGGSQKGLPLVDVLLPDEVGGVQSLRRTSLRSGAGRQNRHSFSSLLQPVKAQVRCPAGCGRKQGLFPFAWSGSWQFLSLEVFLFLLILQYMQRA